jgi:transposase
MKRTVVGVDRSACFQLYWVERDTGEMLNMARKREKFPEHFANRAPWPDWHGSEWGLPALGPLGALGHEVRLLPGRRVKPFVGGNRNDGADARAIWTAMQQPGMKSVAVNSEAQQAVLALHRMRGQLVKFRTAQIKGLRGLLAEYGEMMQQGKAGVRKGVLKALPH